MLIRLTLIALALLFLGSIADVPVMFLAERGMVPLIFVFLTGFLADVVPDFLWYWLGRKIGLERLGRLKIYRQKPERLRRVDRAFHKYGAFILFASKFVYAFGIPSQIVAGAHRFSLKKMFIANALGSAGWLALLYILARALSSVSLAETYIKDVRTVFLIFVAVAALLYLGLSFISRRFFDRS